MPKEINILSVFDGMSCGQLALQRSDVEYKNYYSSEIDKYAIQITQKNFPNTIQLGDVLEWKSWNLPEIFLLMGGSPCQGFSVSGLGLNFEDSRSKLFFEFVDILNYIKPKWFLLENVRMKKEWRDIITSYLGVEPIEIDSALVSAQSRKRLYWTNIPVSLPDDRGILLKDIIECGDVDRDKSYCIDSSYFKGGSLKIYRERKRRQMVKETLRCFQTGVADISGNDMIKRTYDIHGKSPALTTMQGGHRQPKITIDEERWRKLTPVECERLQTVPDNYTKGVSDTQRYKMLGNGWTVDVISHILSGIPTEE